MVTRLETGGKFGYSNVQGQEKYKQTLVYYKDT